jgi:hypothetical protein
MLRLLISLYTTGIVVFFVLFLIFVPKIPLVDAVVGALLWPWGVYRYFVQGGAVV